MVLATAAGASDVDDVARVAEAEKTSAAGDAAATWASTRWRSWST